MNIQIGVPRASVWLIMIICLLAGLIACRPQEITLPFETIEKGEVPFVPSHYVEKGVIPYFPKYYEGKEPKLVVISNVKEIAALGNTVSPDAEAALRQLDFGEYFAIAAYQGLKPWANYSVEIRQIMYQDNVVTIYVHFVEPQPGQALNPAEVSPYHLVKVQKEELTGKKEFILNADGTTVDQQTHTLP